MISTLAILIALSAPALANAPAHEDAASPRDAVERSAPTAAPGSGAGAERSAAPAPQWVDFDGDGAPDLFVSEPTAGDRLLRNDGAGRFVDVTDASGLGTRRPSRAAAWCDFDGDGRQDLFRIDHRGHGALWRNEGGGAFESLGAATGLAQLDGVEAARWLDLDRDGRADLELTTGRGLRLFLGSRSGTFRELALGLGAASGGAPAVGGASAVAGADDPATADIAGAGRPAGPPAERGELAAGRPAQAPPGAAPPGAPARPSGPGGGFGVSATSAGTGPGVSGGLVSPGVAGCADTIVDVATSTCVEASSDPQLGKLYPLGPELNVDSAGNVGIGTTTPSHHVHVEDASTTGTLMHVESTALSGDVTAIRGTTEGETGTGVTGRSKSVTGVNYGVHGRARSVEGVGVFGEAVSLTGFNYGVHGETSSSDGGVGVQGVANTAGPFELAFGVSGKILGTNGTGVIGNRTTDGSVYYSQASGVVGTTDAEVGNGVAGFHIATTGAGWGVHGTTDSDEGVGVEGKAFALAGTAVGVRGESVSDGGVGVEGIASTPGASDVAFGVTGKIEGTDGSAVVGNRTSDGSAYFTNASGVSGFSDADVGTGVAGWHVATTGAGRGVYGSTFSPDGAGVEGVASEPIGSANGVVGETASDYGYGVWGKATNGTGVNFGGLGTSASPDGAGVVGIHDGANLYSPGSGVSGSTVKADAAGVAGIHGAATGAASGVYGASASNEGIGVFGLASDTTSSGLWVGAIGVKGETAASKGSGVHGTATSTAPGGKTFGVFGEAYTDGGVGVGGVHQSDYATSGRVMGGAGLSGSTENGLAAGVRGANYSTTPGEPGIGVYGWSNSREGTAVYGEVIDATGANTGVEGYVTSDSGTAVRGHASATAGLTIGVHGLVDSTNNGFSGPVGVLGEATGLLGNCVGVEGTTVSPTGIGVFAGLGTGGLSTFGESRAALVAHDFTTTDFSRGVWAICDSGQGYAIEAHATAAAGTADAVHARCESPSGYGVYASNAGGPGSWGLFTDADSGVIGTKSFVHPHPTDPTKEIRFVCLEGDESGTYFRGSARLEGGLAVIEVPESFRLVTEEEGLTVQLTALGPVLLWVESKDLERVVVRGASDVAFDYFVNGVRQGFADHEPIQANRSFVPRRRGEAYGASMPPAVRERLVASGILKADFTPDEAFAQRMGWALEEPRRPSAAAPPPAPRAHPPEPESIEFPVAAGAPSAVERVRGLPRRDLGDAARPQAVPLPQGARSSGREDAAGGRRALRPRDPSQRDERERPASDAGPAAGDSDEATTARPSQAGLERER